MIRIFISITDLVALISEKAFSQNLVKEDKDRGVNALTVDGTHSYAGWRLLMSDLRELTNHFIKGIKIDSLCIIFNENLLYEK